MASKAIGIIANTGKHLAVRLLPSIIQELEERGATVFLEAETADFIGKRGGVDILELNERCSLLVVLGGDGTILNVVHRLGPNTIAKPLFGINLGHLGFMTAVSSENYLIAADLILNESYKISPRTVLEIIVQKKQQSVARFVALNDVSISRGSALSRLIHLETDVDGEFLTEYHADGLVISTPTGSTAYSLAAGGPIISPAAAVFLITPICPHVLANRPLIIDAVSTIEVRPKAGSPPEIFATIDGQATVLINPGEVVKVRKALYDIPLAVPFEFSFFNTLRQKLKWGGSTM